MEGGRGRCITEKAVDLPQRVHFLFLAAVSDTFPQVDVTQHVKKCFKLQQEAKKVDTLWKVTGTTTITCKKTRENVYLCTQATHHTPHGPHTPSLLSSLFSCLPFVSLSLFSLSVVCCVVLCCCCFRRGLSKRVFMSTNSEHELATRGLNSEEEAEKSRKNTAKNLLNSPIAINTK